VDAFDRAFMSQVPQMASGGVVKARPGGTLINAAEAGRDEAILPLSSLSELLTSAMASVRPAASELMSSSSSARTSTSEDRSINIGTVVTADNRGMRSELEQLMWSAGAR
jgi:hypothetical protein